MHSPAPESPASPWDWCPPGRRRDRPVTLLRLDGPDSLRVLHGQTSQALEGARPGSRHATCCISATARMRALAEVLVDEDGAWLVVLAGDGAAVRTALDRVLFPADEVRLAPLQTGWLIEPLQSDPADPAGTSEASERSWTPLPDEAGWQLGAALLLREGCEPQGLLAALTPLDAAEAERWRISRGEPAAPTEINEEHNPFELGLADRVSLSKGCYLGQETLAKLATYDGVRQQLRRWHCPTAAPAAGTVLQGADGERAGRISSSLSLPEGGAIGLALVRRQALAEARLRAGEAAEAPLLDVSQAPGFAAPPQR
ncbi:MAG: folate-binding protein [Synechococcaceae cyanobacterium]|nr:folate-binding protein [Synechococcaceae cyanobacterium]